MDTDMQLDYDLELPRVVGEIKELGKDGTAKVCLQLPDGLKMNALQIVKELQTLTKKENLEAEFYIWTGSNFGGCDYPWYLKDLKFDLLVNFGHAVFRKWTDRRE
ncbi:MAG: hypothetical protein J4445_01730 [DPANN group archaeon]|nr:hypothetical protein [DPANN group archaeon]